MADRPTETGAAPPAKSGGSWLNEDWIATILGLIILALVLTGVIPQGVIP